ncbi:hypothetical protein V1477_001475 [Vespula maculifrons]|uniref:Uncharacterized protein n=1 Tax=Vespula maculifrons TaxID=7453 RepID=A0ABD2D1P6_VESMC
MIILKGALVVARLTIPSDLRDTYTAVRRTANKLQVIPSVVVEPRYTKPTENESSSDRLDVLQRSRVDLYLNCNSKKDTKSKSVSSHELVIYYKISSIHYGNKTDFRDQCYLNYCLYTKSKEDESSSNSLDVLQRSRIQLYLNCNSKEDTKSSTSLHQIKHCTSKVKHIYIDTFCSSVHPTICLTWIVQIKPDLQRG